MLAEEEGGQLDQVLAPGEPGVHAGSFEESNGHAAGLEEGDETAVGGEQAILDAAGDPEQAQVGLLGIEGAELLGVGGAALRGPERFPRGIRRSRARL